jgi:glycine cleavage system aminomethyltransferase T
MVEFGGWDMPLQYPSGTIAEHLACRRSAVVFDVSHLGTVRVTGSDALARLQATLTNDLGKVAAGRAQYTHLLDESDGSVLDDIIVWWVAERVEHRARARCPRRHGHHRGSCRAGGAGPGRPGRSRARVPRGGRGRAVPRRGRPVA